MSVPKDRLASDEIDEIVPSEADIAAFEVDDAKPQPEPEEPELRPCLFCQETTLALAQIPVAGCSPDFAVECETCHARGPVASIRVLAIQYYQDGLRFMHGSDELPEPKKRRRRRPTGVSTSPPH
jgi:hypothetical protein